MVAVLFGNPAGLERGGAAGGKVSKVARGEKAGREGRPGARKLRELRETVWRDRSSRAGLAGA